jgi:hypothetical protein
MPVLKKKDFSKMRLVYESVDETIDELVDPDGSFIDSAVPDGNEVDIMTGPVETPARDRGTTTYKKGVSPTTDRVRRNTSQGDDWQQAFAGLGGTGYSHGSRIGSWIGWLHEDVIGEDVLSNKSDSDDMVNKITDKELIKNKEFMDIIAKIGKMDNKEKEELHKLLSDAKS